MAKVSQMLKLKKKMKACNFTKNITPLQEFFILCNETNEHKSKIHHIFGPLWTAFHKYLAFQVAQFSEKFKAPLVFSFYTNSREIWWSNLQKSPQTPFFSTSLLYAIKRCLTICNKMYIMCPSAWVVIKPLLW